MKYLPKLFTISFQLIMKREINKKRVCIFKILHQIEKSKKKVILCSIWWMVILTPWSSLHYNSTNIERKLKENIPNVLLHITKSKEKPEKSRKSNHLHQNNGAKSFINSHSNLDKKKLQFRYSKDFWEGNKNLTKSLS